MKIRKLEQKDIERVVDIWFEASILAHDFIPIDTWEAHKGELRDKYLQISETWVAEEEGQVLGFISLLNNYIGGLFVAPVKQGMGVGTKLIHWAKKEKGHLTVGVYSKNRAARKFYSKNGFIVTNEELQPETGEMVVNMAIE